MKNLFLALMLIFAWGCSEQCETCTYITEDNVNHAQLKCDGKANNYPNAYDETARENLGELCQDERDQIRTGNLETFIICSGVNATVRARLECR